MILLDTTDNRKEFPGMNFHGYTSGGKMDKNKLYPIWKDWHTYWYWVWFFKYHFNSIKKHFLNFE